MRNFKRYTLTLIIILALLISPLVTSAQVGEESNTSYGAESQNDSWVIWKQLCPLGADLKSVPLPGYPPFLAFCVLQGTDFWLWKDVCPSPIITVFEPGLGTHAVCETVDMRGAKKGKNTNDEPYEQLIE